MTKPTSCPTDLSSPVSAQIERDFPFAFACTLACFQPSSCLHNNQYLAVPQNHAADNPDIVVWTSSTAELGQRWMLRDLGVYTPL